MRDRGVTHTRYGGGEARAGMTLADHSQVLRQTTKAKILGALALLATACSGNDGELPTEAQPGVGGATSSAGGEPGGGGSTHADGGAGGIGGSGGSDPTDNWPPPPLPAGCPYNARILPYDPIGWSHLANAFAADPAPCADYYIHLPALANEKTSPRGPKAVDEVHALGGRFHAVAEFHWGGWSQVTTMTWLERGKAFREKMIERGYHPERDTWAINELPSSVRSNAEVRQAVRDVVKGLYSGPEGSIPMDGIVWVIGMPTDLENFSVYKPNMKDWLSEAPFWNDMKKYVRWWGQEVYTDPYSVCVSGSSPGTQAEHINDFVMHPAKLAVAGGEATFAARSFFDGAYFPLMNAAWKSEVYDTTSLTLDQMKHHVSTQIYAARLWSNDHAYPDWRTGFAWKSNPPGATEAQIQELAARIARAVRYAYSDDGAGASTACSPSGAYTWCDCSLGGAEFNDGWSTFESW